MLWLNQKSLRWRDLGLIRDSSTFVSNHALVFRCCASTCVICQDTKAGAAFFAAFLCIIGHATKTAISRYNHSTHFVDGIMQAQFKRVYIAAVPSFIILMQKPYPTSTHTGPRIPAPEADQTLGFLPFCLGSTFKERFHIRPVF